MLHTVPRGAGAAVTVPNLSCAEPVMYVVQTPNVAVTDAAALMDDTVHVPVPVQPAPLQPVKPAAVAVNVTVVPAAKLAVQVPLQLLMPGGELLTVPAPVPALVTVIG